MVDQIGYREPYDFVDYPPGLLGTKESIRGLGLWGTIRVHGGPLEGPSWTIGDHGRSKGTMGDHTRPLEIIWHKVLGFVVGLSCEFVEY